ACVGPGGVVGATERGARVLVAGVETGGLLEGGDGFGALSEPHQHQSDIVVYGGHVRIEPSRLLVSLQRFLEAAVDVVQGVADLVVNAGVLRAEPLGLIELKHGLITTTQVREVNAEVQMCERVFWVEAGWRAEAV